MLTASLQTLFVKSARRRAGRPAVIVALLRRLGVPALLLFLWLPGTLPAAVAPVPAGYQFKSVLDTLSASVFRTGYVNQVMSLNTAVNANGTLIGFWLTPEGEFHTHSLLFGTNPKEISLDTTGFIGLSGSDVSCFFFFTALICSNEYSYGIRVLSDGVTTTGVSAFVNTPTDSAAIAGSLPFTLYPGNFVDENHAGVLATTQIAADFSQYGVLMSGNTAVTLDNVPWLIAINDLAEPLVLAYDGVDGECLVYGSDCLPECNPEDGDTHSHQNGRGHEEHGQGYGYGHEKCHHDDTATTIAPRSGIVISPETGNGALLIRLLADFSTLRYRFPSEVTIGDGTVAVNDLFPLAINNSRAILRGDVTVDGTTYERRLLSCVFDPAALDPGGDGTVDCSGGMTLIGGSPANSVRVGTVLGFTLNDNGTLTGNRGYSAAGVGTPFVLDVAATTPVAVPLSTLTTSADAWEINTLTDLNMAGRITGYGYRDCALLPEAFFIDALASAPAANALRFEPGAFEYPALLEPGTVLTIAPTVIGGSGSYEFRVSTRVPGIGEWALLSDWSVQAGTYDPGSHLGDVCLRVEVRDAAAPETVRAEIVRYRVASNDPSSPPAGDEGRGNSTVLDILVDANAELADLLGAGSIGQLLMLAVLALRRRRT